MRIVLDSKEEKARVSKRLTMPCSRHKKKITLFVKPLLMTS